MDPLPYILRNTSKIFLHTRKVQSTDELIILYWYCSLIYLQTILCILLTFVQMWLYSVPICIFGPFHVFGGPPTICIFDSKWNLNCVTEFGTKMDFNYLMHQHEKYVYSNKIWNKWRNLAQKLIVNMLLKTIQIWI